jgi:hypothetical protein
VWQGSAGDRRPYADLVGYSEKVARQLVRAINVDKSRVQIIKRLGCRT